MATEITFQSCDFGSSVPLGTPILYRQRTFPLDAPGLKRSRSLGGYRGPLKSQVSLTLSHWDSETESIVYGELVANFIKLHFYMCLFPQFQLFCYLSFSFVSWYCLIMSVLIFWVQLFCSLLILSCWFSK